MICLKICELLEPFKSWVIFLEVCLGVIRQWSKYVSVGHLNRRSKPYLACRLLVPHLCFKISKIICSVIHF